jgi:hypothetical protein
MNGKYDGASPARLSSPACGRSQKSRRAFESSFYRYLGIERLEDRLLLSLTGHAPQPYPEASVSAQVGPILGVLRTIDDGVVVEDLRVGQTDAAASIVVTSATSGTVLDGWIDFNGDGSFGGALEQIFDSVPLTNGTSTLNFEVPSWAADGQTFSRFRLSRGIPMGLPQDGSAANGEVEDYPVFIHSPLVGSGDFGSESNITGNGAANGVVDVLTIDIDLDGDIDVVSSSHIDGEIAIYRSNATLTSWTRTVVGNVAGTGDPNEVNAVGLAAGDLDGDGDIDLVSASNIDDTIAWYRNNGTATPSFTKFTVTTQANGARAVVVVDLNRDGQLDLASLSLFDDSIRVHQNTGSTTPSLLFNSVVAVAFPLGSLPADLYASDMDRDGWDDLVSITAVTNRVAWHRNDGTPFSGAWDVGTTIFDGANTINPNGSGVFAGDIDGEGDLDVVATSFGEDRIDWFRNSDEGSSWSGRLAVGGAIVDANPSFVADIDGDGDMDVLTPAFNGDRVYFHRNDGGAGTFALGDSVLFDTGTNVSVADINGDGALDIVAGGHDSDRISWWENPLLAPEIVVTGNGLNISDGDPNPRIADGTDFGQVELGGSTSTTTFLIENDGAGTLAIGSVSVPDGYSLIEIPIPYLQPGETTQLTVRLDSASVGTKHGQIRIDTNDTSESLFNFEITGVVASVTIVAGDYNRDSIVNSLDYQVWRSAFGSVGANLPADGNGNGIVDTADYVVWRKSAGNSAIAIAAGGGAVDQDESDVPRAAFGPTSASVTDGSAAVALIQTRAESTAAPRAFGGESFGGQSAWKEWGLPPVVPIIGRHVAVSTGDDLLLLATDRVRRSMRQDFMLPHDEGQAVVEGGMSLIYRTLELAIAEWQ